MSQPTVTAALQDCLERVATVSWEHLDPTTRDAALRALFDSLGIAAGGAMAPGLRETLDGVAAFAGQGPVPVPWWGHRLPPADAAFATSALIHAWDFDDVHDAAVVHACAVAVPAALAVAHAVDATGTRFLEGFMAGVEFVCRLSLALGPQRGVIRTAGLGSLGAAAAAARVLEMGVDGLEAALSLAVPVSLSPTSRQVVEDGAISKRHQPGFTVRHGVAAAYLARAGLRGPVGWFAGTYGLAGFAGDCAGAALARDGWEIERLSLKPYPACRYTHAAVDAALRLVAALGSGETVDRVTVHVPAGMGHELVARPWERRGQPVIDAQFSIPWLVGAALHLGRVDLGVISGPLLVDQAIEQRARTVEAVQDGEADASGMTPVRLRAILVDGSRRTVAVDRCPGSPERPLGWEAIAVKVRRCLEAAGCDPAVADDLRGIVTMLPETSVQTAVEPLVRTGMPTVDKEPITWTSG